MRLEIPLTEVQEFVSKNYHLAVGFTNVGGNKVIVDYFVSFTLTVKEVRDDEVVFHYETKRFINLLAKGVHFLFRKKLAHTPMIWNPATREVAVDLNRVPALRELLKFLYLSELLFVNGTILLELKTKPVHPLPAIIPANEIGGAASEARK